MSKSTSNPSLDGIGITLDDIGTTPIKVSVSQYPLRSQGDTVKFYFGENTAASAAATVPNVVDVTKNTNDDDDNEIKNAAIECEWTCIGYGASGGPDVPLAITCIQCTIPASSGLFDWYRSIYSNDDGMPLDEPAKFYLSPAAAALAEHLTAPSPPLDKKRNILIEHIVKDVFGERVQSVHQYFGTYPVAIGKTSVEDGDSDLLDVHFKAETVLW
ncbi:hypothetical protein BGZ82_001354 [Podila clonocystis]|nr:hypothetical protein BGZ82_001354 [Podila clonocystis]